MTITDCQIAINQEKLPYLPQIRVGPPVSITCRKAFRQALKNLFPVFRAFFPGLLFFHDKDYFVDAAQKRFRLDLLIPFLKEQGIALFDTATRIRRTTGTASDKDLEIVEETDLHQMLRRLPLCKRVVTAGQLATEIACSQFGVEPPKVGESVPFEFEGRQLWLFRMPSSSRAYPMKLEQKAVYYQRVLLP